MANILQLSLPSYTTYLSGGDINSLASGSMAIGLALDNNTNRYTHVTWRLQLNTLTPTTAGYVELYCLPGDASGGNFAEGSGSVQPQPGYLVWLWPLRAASSAPYHFTDPLPFPPFSKWLIRNVSGAAFNASANVLAYAPQNLTVE